jgi:hypothetical protein
VTDALIQLKAVVRCAGEVILSGKLPEGPENGTSMFLTTIYVTNTPIHESIIDYLRSRFMFV